MKEQLLNLIADLPTPGFFITAEASRVGKEMPTDIERFIHEKIATISAGGKSRKFVFAQGDWRIILTFFATDSVVEERYALKNKRLRQ